MATIKAIEGKSIHQIQSGQVIVDLCSVVKELVENSLDAGATNIEVRFKNQGLDSIEVQDNGDGISPQNYETIALKHYTSKLSSYSDLETLHTFGFRGEALSSLCALSCFTITTCLASDAPKATKLDFEISGKLKSTRVVAAQKGTTVSVESLFNNLPVRRRELERNIKVQWNKVVTVLSQYACIQTGVKFSVTQQTTKGKKATLFSTKGNPTTRENIVNVFGAKTFTALLTLDLKLELEPTSEPSQRWSTQNDGGKKIIRIVGHISRPASGEGRQTPDKQMFYVNARPCVLPQVAKAFNEVYKSYNSSQSPFIFANIEMDTHMYDVNVSPDKRTIMLHDQGQMLEELKTSLTELFECQDYTVPISQISAQKLPSYRQMTISKPNTPAKQTPQAMDESTEDLESDGLISDHETDKDIISRPNNTESPCSLVSRALVGQDPEPITRTSNWLDKKADSSAHSEVPVSKPAAGNQGDVSNEKTRLIAKLVKEREDAKVFGDQSEADTESSAGSPESSPSLAIPVVNWDQNLADHISHEDQIQERNGPVPRASTQASIPVLVSPAKQQAPGVVGIVGTTSPRLRREPPMLATITIGGRTVTSPMETHHSRKSSLKGVAESLAKRSPLPSFRSGLSQRFAAPGTDPLNQVDSTEMGDEVEDMSNHESDVEDSQSLASERSISENNVSCQLMEEVSVPTFEPVEEPGSSISPIVEEADDEYLDDDEKKAREDTKVQEMIRQAEHVEQNPVEDASKRRNFLKGGSRKKDATVHFTQTLNTSTLELGSQLRVWADTLAKSKSDGKVEDTQEAFDSETAEEKLSLTIHKSDFARMKIVGQFNLGFILASRRSQPGTGDEKEPLVRDDLFIIDQHASDEKFNFERLQAATVVQSQRLVRPKTLDLTAVEEEVVIENLVALQTNGFVVTVDDSGYSPVGQRCQLISLPLSRETTFDLSDLEELIALLAEQSSGNNTVPRPSKVRKMFAMRACRSSIMIGRTLTHKQMGKVVNHMGEIDKPWNCPHGRPTMRHLCGLGSWDELGWREGDDVEGEKIGAARIKTNWAVYVRDGKGDT